MRGLEGADVPGRRQPQPLVRELEGRLQARGETDEPVPEPEEAPRQAAGELPDGDPGLGQGGGADEVVDGLGLEDVQPAVGIGPERELPGVSRPRPGRDAEPDDLGQDDGAPVAAQFDDILPGVGVRRPEIGEDGLVEDLLPGRVDDAPEDRPPGGEGTARPAPGPEEPAGHGQGPLAADADDAQSADPGRCRNGDDGIFEHGAGRPDPF